MKCELQPSLLPVQLHGLEQMQVQVLVQVPKPLLLPEMVLLVELVPVSELQTSKVALIKLCRLFLATDLRDEPRITD